MNAEFSIYLDLDGDTTVIESLIADFADVILSHGLASPEDPEAAVRSLILVKPLDGLDLDQEIERSFYAVVPTKGEEDV